MTVRYQHRNVNTQSYGNFSFVSYYKLSLFIDQTFINKNF